MTLLAFLAGLAAGTFAAGAWFARRLHRARADADFWQAHARKLLREHMHDVGSLRVSAAHTAMRQSQTVRALRIENAALRLVLTQPPERRGEA